MASIGVLYSRPNNVNNHLSDCYCTKVMHSGLYSFQKENKFSTSNLSPFIYTFKPHSNTLYLCLLGAGAEGVEGFFKGIGKGLLGLLVHPTGGVVDMVSFTLDGVRRLNFLYFNLVSHKYVNYWPLERPMDWPTEWQGRSGWTDWLTGWRTDGGTEGRTDKRRDALIDRLTVCLTDWLSKCRIAWLCVWLSVWLSGWLTDWLTDGRTDERFLVTTMF